MECGLAGGAAVYGQEVTAGRYVAHAEVVAGGRTLTRVARPFTMAR